MTQNQIRETFLNTLKQSPTSPLRKKEIVAMAATAGLSYPYFLLNDPAHKAQRGWYHTTPQSVGSQPTTQTAEAISSPAPVVTIQTLVTDAMVPVPDNSFVPFGHYQMMKTLIDSKKFYPVFITGDSGNGKTYLVEQVCAKLKRPWVLVSMTSETDEGDLLGNFVLVNHTMVWKDGPVTTAAKQGAVLVLDEMDYGNANLTTLQRVMEGKPFLLKKKNEWVTPAPGFTVIATANTKGRGSDNGRYLYTNILNEAFLERFPMTLEQDWAPKHVEKKILQNAGAEEDFATMLVDWAGIIRKTFADGGCQEVISTRRLVAIIRAMGIFKDRMTAITVCLNRFENETKTSFLDLYTKIDVSVAPPVVPDAVPTEPSTVDESPII